MKLANYSRGCPAAFGRLVVFTIATLVALPGRASSQDSGESRTIAWKSGSYTIRRQDIETKRRLLAVTSAATDVKHFVVQLDQPLTTSKRTELQDAGLELQQPLGRDAFFAAWRPSGDVDLVSADPTILAIERIRTQWKLHPDLLAKSPPNWTSVPSDGRGPDRFAVYLLLHWDEIPNGDVIDAIHRRGGRIVGDLSSVKGAVAELPLEEIGAIAGFEEVSWIEPALPRLQPANDFTRWRCTVDAVQSAPYGLQGNGISVMVYDGAAWSPHPDFGGRLVDHDPFLNYAQCCPFEINHGTFVAGIVGAGPSSFGAGNFRGMAPAVRIESFALDSFLGGFYLNSYDIQADYSAAINNHGVVSANASLTSNMYLNGGPCNWYGAYGVTDNLNDAITRGVLGKPIVNVWCAGNERSALPNGPCFPIPGYDSLSPPANAKNSICVGAVDGLNDGVTSFSSWGPSDDGRTKPDIVAPGVSIFTLSYLGYTGGYYEYAGGTSAAAPAVTGMSALVAEDHRARNPGSPDLLNSSVKALFAHTAADTMTPGPDFQTGYGSVRIQPAIDTLRAGGLQEVAISQGTSHELGIWVSTSAEPFKCTIAWDDPPAAPGVLNTLVNDIDLVVLDPDGLRAFPWTLNPGIPSDRAVRNQEDHVNNLEQVWVGHPKPGLWRVQVRGTNVPVAPQTVSICANQGLHGWFVNDSAAGPNHDGKSPATGFLSIQQAVQVAVDGDSILVLPGSYYETLDFLGKQLRVASSGGKAVTYVDAGQGGSCVRFLNGEDARTVLDGFTLRSGSAVSGGGILCLNSSPNIRNCIVEYCQASNGGGLYCGAGAAPKLVDCTLQLNSATVGGGAYFASGSAGASSGLVVKFNSASADGGGIAVLEASTPDLSGTVLLQNSAAQRGGGLFAAATSPKLASASLVENQAGSGGGAYLSAAPGVVLDGASLTGNIASTTGGGLTIDGPGPDVNAITCLGNQAAQGGGLALLSGNASQITNAIVLANLATDQGGGVYASSASPRLLQCTIASNNAANLGGGVGLQSGGSGSLTNSILWGNMAVAGASISAQGSLLSVSYCDVEGGWTGVGNIALDPSFVDLGNGKVELTQTSPCIDTGNASVPGLPAKDYSGDPRVVHGAVDMGADEHAFLYFPGQYTNLQNAINAAVSGTTILVTPGNYTIPANFGAFAPALKVHAKDVMIASTAGPEATVLHHSTGALIQFQDVSGAAGIRGFKIKSAALDSGAIYVDRTYPFGVCSPTIEDNVIEGINCWVSPIYSFSGHYGKPVIRNNLIINNTGRIHGGGLNLVGDGATPNGAYVIGNTISGNSAAQDGGGIYCRAEDVLIEGNIVTDNIAGTATFATRGGGGIFVDYRVAPRVAGNTIAGNRAPRGGGIAAYQSGPILDRNLIFSNRAQATFAGSGLGGGIDVRASNAVRMSNNTVAANLADLFGGGIHIDAPTPEEEISTAISLQDILWLNSAPTAPAVALTQSIWPASFSATFSDIQGSWPGLGNFSQDPQFVDSANGNFHLNPGSPCIDAGDPESSYDEDGTRADLGALPTCTVPTIAFLNPAVGSARGGTTVVVTGTGFSPTTIVFFDGTMPQATVFVSSTTLKVVTPAHALPGPVAGAGSSFHLPSDTVDVVVSNGCASDTTVAGFTFAAFGVPSKH